jgi:hypothetical protein
MQRGNWKIVLLGEFGELRTVWFGRAIFENWDWRQFAMGGFQDDPMGMRGRRRWGRTGGPQFERRKAMKEQ